VWCQARSTDAGDLGDSPRRDSLIRKVRSNPHRRIRG